jgi:hypothetical protein
VKCAVDFSLGSEISEKIEEGIAQSKRNFCCSEAPPTNWVCSKTTALLLVALSISCSFLYSTEEAYGRRDAKLGLKMYLKGTEKPFSFRSFLIQLSFIILKSYN